ncbi:hypothetical protein NE237_006647 [Protea cynaroides]|uniref:Small auxin up regulated protein n=1 Tax=Protea cynaroides TaxID=273540 RepID=A0A9Q0KMP2_9MAGN|nr:hypothetical protein NE237_006647 [Protea cynaroides]
MEVAEKSKGKKGLILKTWQLCRSMSSRGPRNRLFLTPILKSRSWTPRIRSSPLSSPADKSCSSKRTRRLVVPEGCFTVYVGPERQRFVIKTECVNHPLFKILLEEAELEYGYYSQGPLSLPCDVDLFYKVLSEMDCGEVRQGCSFAKRCGSYDLLTPPRMLGMNGF